MGGCNDGIAFSQRVEFVWQGSRMKSLCIYPHRFFHHHCFANGFLSDKGLTNFAATIDQPVLNRCNGSTIRAKPPYNDCCWSSAGRSVKPKAASAVWPAGKMAPLSLMQTPTTLLRKLVASFNSSQMEVTFILAGLMWPLLLWSVPRGFTNCIFRTIDYPCDLLSCTNCCQRCHGQRVLNLYKHRKYDQRR